MKTNEVDEIAMEEIKQSKDIKYRNILILDKTNSLRDLKYPKFSIEPLFKADICFYHLENGGLECIKDRYGSYGKGTVWFGMWFYIGEKYNEKRFIG